MNHDDFDLLEYLHSIVLNRELSIVKLHARTHQYLVNQ